MVNRLLLFENVTTSQDTEKLKTEIQYFRYYRSQGDYKIRVRRNKKNF
jgi:hypothetical protein